MRRDWFRSLFAPRVTVTMNNRVLTDEEVERITPRLETLHAINEQWHAAFDAIFEGVPHDRR